MNEPGLDMIVCTALTLSDGSFRQGPTLRVEQGHRRQGGAFDWYVRHLNSRLELVDCGTVFGHRLQHEPLLCLAARAAWSLWNDDTPFEDLEDYVGLVVEVTYGEDNVATIFVELDSVRTASLRRQSDDHLASASAAAARAELALAASSAIQAGYCAVLSMLSSEEILSHPDHPNGRAAALGAVRLGLSPEDQTFGEQAAANFYAPHPERLWSFDECLGWARRARMAAGWHA